MVHYVDNFDAKMYEMDSPWTLSEYPSSHVSPHLFFILISPRFGWFKRETSF